MSELSEQLESLRDRTEATRAAEERAFLPAETMEGLALRVMGGWENLMAEVNFSRYHAAGNDAGPLDREQLAKAVRILADDSRIRWPHDEWALAANSAKFTRDTLGHMLYIDSVTGEAPNRTMTITLLGAPGESRKAADGNPGELSWRDPVWSTQTRHSLPLSEHSLIETLYSIKWMIDCCRGLGRIRDLLAEDGADLPDEKVIDPYAWQVNWWLPKWGDRKTTQLTVGQIRLRPGEKN